MADQHDPAAGDANGPLGGMPRWVKLFLIILAVAVVAAIVTFLAGVDHGPRLHGP